MNYSKSYITGQLNYLLSCLLSCLLIAFFLFSAPAEARTKKKQRPSCNCTSGCGMITKGLAPTIAKLVQATRAQGVNPISCIRTQACQDKLYKCYNRCGQRGRAAKVSKHKDGLACDYSARNGGTITKVKKKNRLNVQRLQHTKGQGGGLHEHTGKSSKKYKKPKPYKKRRKK